MRLLLAALVLAPTLAAQEIPAIRAARDHFRAAPADARLATADLEDLRAVAVHLDSRTGVTFVTMAQHANGLEVFGTASGAAVTRSGAVSAPAPSFEAGVARRAGPATPALDAASAAAVARQVGLEAALALPARGVVYDDPAMDRRTDPALEAGEPRLGYHEMNNGELRLAWDVEVASTSGPTVLRSVRVDAVTGAVLTDLDLVVHDTWEHRPTSRTATSIVDALAPTSRTSAAASQNAVPSYLVIPAPFESPSLSPLVAVINPADPASSSLGWHSTGAIDYTITRGNNVYAYTDTDNNNVPDVGSSPDGGSALVFDRSFVDDAGRAAAAPAAVTNLFYWNNIVHDVLYRYGFDEAAGNFQVTNATGDGRGNDAVNAEALDGSGTNNANFSTPSDGSSPRMQMFRWTSVTLEVGSPSSLAGEVPTATASFGPGGDFAGRLVPAGGGSGANHACTRAEITGNVSGLIALIERGGCDFDSKVANAASAGAIGAIVYNRAPAEEDADDNGGDVLVSMGGDGSPVVTIPSAFVRRSDGLRFAASAEPVQISVVQLPDRSSSFDSGIVAHEYGHGISNRLIGGPGRVSCLSNGRSGNDTSGDVPGEQMGEGWSDYYGLMLTQRASDTAGQRRGVGTYVQFDTPDGRGIRPAPYSTDFAVNNYTYQDIVDNAVHRGGGSRALSIPHGVGFAWATMLWEMTWDLIEAEGFSDDIANADGMAGNQIALNLVTTGLKLTPCLAGFVDGRDAILAADAALYPQDGLEGVGRHHDLIWAAFARRGLGVLASQGSATANNDGKADFSTPPPVNPPGPVATDGDPSSTFEVSAVAPNPASRSTRIAVTVSRAQSIEIVLYDALGRRIRQQTAAVAAGQPRDLEVALEGLPAGVYALRVTGETASETRSLTVVR